MEREDKGAPKSHYVLHNFQDFPNQLVSKTVALQHAWSRNEKERSGQLIALTAKLAARAPTFPIHNAIYTGSSHNANSLSAVFN